MGTSASHPVDNLGQLGRTSFFIELIISMLCMAISALLPVIKQTFIAGLAEWIMERSGIESKTADCKL